MPYSSYFRQIGFRREIQSTFPFLLGSLVPRDGGAVAERQRVHGQEARRHQLAGRAGQAGRGRGRRAQGHGGGATQDHDGQARRAQQGNKFLNLRRGEGQ